METLKELSPAAQVAAIIMLGLVAIAYFITITQSWESIAKIFRRK